MIGYSKKRYKAKLLAQLKKANEYDFLVNVEFITTHCCPVCDKLKDVIMPLEQALNEQLLPPPDCTRPYGGCICCYGFIGIRDDNGRLKKK